MTARRTVWTLPIVLAVATSGGLLSALLGDGLWDALSWAALAAPVFTCLWFGLRVRRRAG